MANRSAHLLFKDTESRKADELCVICLDGEPSAALTMQICAVCAVRIYDELHLRLCFHGPVPVMPTPTSSLVEP